MNTIDSDLERAEREEYRTWWESLGRADLTVCPCGRDVEDYVFANGTVIPGGHGLCYRHRVDLTGGNREMLAQAMIADPFLETPLTAEDRARAQLVADGFLGGRPN